MLHGTVNPNKLQGERKQSLLYYREIWYCLMLFPFSCLYLCMYYKDASVSSFILKTWSSKTKQKKQLVWSFALNSWFVTKWLGKKDYSIQVQKVLTLTDQVCNQALPEPVLEVIPWILVLMDHAEVCLFFPTEILGDIMLIQTECNFCYFYICDIKMTLHCYTATQLHIGGKKTGTCRNRWVKPLKVTHTLVMLMTLVCH